MARQMRPPSAKPFDRLERLSVQFQRQLSEIIHAERLCQAFGLVTLSHVRITRDLSQARVYVSTLDSDPARVLEALNQSAKLLRTALGKRLHLRRVPQLTFIHDQELADQMRLGALLSQLATS